MPKKTGAPTQIIGVCAGRACTDRKSKKLRKRLKGLIKDENLEGCLKVKKTECLGKCGDGPVVEVRPGHREYTRVKPKKAGKLLAKIR
jgi:NADH:ubiquinone oxidoreductase subunit E